MELVLNGIEHSASQLDNDVGSPLTEVMDLLKESGAEVHAAYDGLWEEFKAQFEMASA